MPAGNLRWLIAGSIQIERLEQMRTPLHVIVTGVLTGRELRLSEGPAVDAVLASAAILGVFTPVEIAGRRLMDGGGANTTPISHAVELGAEEIYVLPTGFPCALRAHPRGALAMLLHAESLLIQQRLLVEIELYRDRAHLVVLPPPVQPIDFAHAGELIERALTESRSYLEWLEHADAPDTTTAAVQRLLGHSHTHTADSLAAPARAQRDPNPWTARRRPSTRKRITTPGRSFQWKRTQYTPHTCNGTRASEPVCRSRRSCGPARSPASRAEW